MSDINLWNKTLSNKEVSAWEECKLDKGGNIIDWETADWTSSGLEEVVINKKDLCEEIVDSHFIASNIKRNFVDTQLLSQPQLNHNST